MSEQNFCQHYKHEHTFDREDGTRCTNCGKVLTILETLDPYERWKITNVGKGNVTVHHEFEKRIRAMSEWIPIEESGWPIPTTNMIRNLFEAAYPDRIKDFDRWLKKTRLETWDTAIDYLWEEGEIGSIGEKLGKDNNPYREQ